MTDSIEDFIAAFPTCIEAEFVMTLPDEPIQLSTGKFDLLRDGQVMGALDGKIMLEWVPKLRITCTGESNLGIRDTLDNHFLHLSDPHLGLTSEVFIKSVSHGQSRKIQALLMEAENKALKDIYQFRFYLVNFPHFMGEPVRTSTCLARDRLRMTAGPLVCTIDRIRIEDAPEADQEKPGYLLTHIAEVSRPKQLIAPSELQEILDAFHWLFAFMRGARAGPVLPSTGSPFATYWISIAPWKINEPRCVDSWMPSRSQINVDQLFSAFLERWKSAAWNEALRTTIAWYIAANSPSAPSEAKIPLCQIALEVLASLQGLEKWVAHKRIRGLLESLCIPIQVPPRLQALYSYATDAGIDAPECLTRIRNKLEHPTTNNRKQAEAIDGATRMQAAQYGLELFELCLLAMMNYRGKYTRRAFQGWKGDDEVPVPWS